MAKYSDEQRAVLTARQKHTYVGAFGWMQERRYLTRVDGSWQLNESGQRWLNTWRDWKG